MRPSIALLALLLVTPPALLTCAAGATSDPGKIGVLPGADAYAPELAVELGAALQARGADYEPRTRHRREDGSALYTNRLILESSPYLLQHAHNPVNWFPWGDEAFEIARKLGRPVLLSVGYSTCHWCHVMEEESFEDEEVAAYLNANYVAIKVDREERPDVDGVYMAAVQMLTGRGGWPMTTWLTPDRKPFFGGTYFPPRDGDRGARKGFLTLLREMKAAYDEQPDQIAARARQITDRIQESLTPDAGASIPATQTLSAAVRSYRSAFDEEYGGRRGAPKFPSNLPVRLLLWQYSRTGEPRLLEMATRTLSAMASGGIYDHVGGGFHRYSVDARWLVPHFEKMLYDNALLTVAYLEGYQATGEERFAQVAREILRYVGREMTSPEGGFYSATDADSLNPEGEREEGWYFTWTPREIETVLGAEAAKQFGAYYPVTEAGNFEGRNILHVTRSLTEVANELGTDPERLEARLATWREKLWVARGRRPAPLRDEKILAAWNGLMISAMARGGFVLTDEETLERATRAADFVLREMRVDGRLRRSYKDGAARHRAYLDDYAFVVAGLLDLYEATAERRWLVEAIALQERLDADYLDPEDGGYFMTAKDHETLLAREKPAYDGAEPSGNSVTLLNLMRLSELTSDDGYRARAEGLKGALAGVLARRPTAIPEALLALEFEVGVPQEIVVATPGPRSAAAPFLDVLRKTFVPDKVIAILGENAAREQASLVPLLGGKVARDGKTTAYVCERGVCKLPTADVETFRSQLGSPAPDARHKAVPAP